MSIDCTKGWKYLYNTPKQHYFVDGHSLCGRWLTLGAGDCTPDNGEPQRDECVSCRRKLTPELAPKPKPRKKKQNAEEVLAVYKEVVNLMVGGRD